MKLEDKQVIITYSVLPFLIGLVLGLAVWIFHPVVKTVYTNHIKMTCAIFNETGNYTMYCNPIDIEKYGDKNITFGFELPSNPNIFNISRIILCTYDLNNQRFVECHQYNYGVEPLNETSK